MNPTVKQTVVALRRRLNPIYGKGETRDMIRCIFEYLKGWNTTQMLIHEGDELSDMTLENIRNIETRLQTNEPLQYITGIAPFYGMDFSVDRRVLIPRPETAEMVDLIVNKYRRTLDMRVLDVATGSGCVAIALARNLPFSHVTAIDISSDALEVAADNNKRLNGRVQFEHADMMDYTPEPESLDLVVSNPPYVLESERSQMSPNVLDYEPAGALFVTDSDPIRFNARVAQIATVGLKPGGALYMEINPLCAVRIHAALADLGFADIEIIKDIHGRDRIVSALKPTDD